MSVTQWVRPRQRILIRSILPVFLFTPHKMARGGGEGRRFALNCGPTSERKRKTKRVPFGERRGGSSVPGCNANATRAMYSQNRLTGRHRNHYSHQNLRCSAYASHCPKTTPNLQPIPPPFDPLARIKRPLVPRKAMVRRKITYYKMLTPERRVEIAAAPQTSVPKLALRRANPRILWSQATGRGSRSNVRGGGRGTEGPRWV